jgi:hypothetical protein
MPPGGVERANHNWYQRPIDFETELTLRHDLDAVKEKSRVQIDLHHIIFAAAEMNDGLSPEGGRNTI